MIGDAGEDVGEPCLRIDIVQLGCEQAPQSEPEACCYFNSVVR